MSPPRRILIVDDDPDIRLITELALKLDAGWTVRSVASAKEARALLAARWDPHMILADVSMPGGSGLDLMQEVQACEAGRSLAVVLFTASVRQQDVEQFKAAGAAGVVTKPFDPLRLGDELRRILDMHSG